MKATILFMVTAVFFTASGLVLEQMKEPEGLGRAEAQINEQRERYEALQTNGAPQCTFVWASFNLGVF